jgi:hypothetical protein
MEDQAQPSLLDPAEPLAVGKRAVVVNHPTAADPGIDFVYPRRMAPQQRLLLGKSLVANLPRRPEHKPLGHGGGDALGWRLRRRRALAFAIGLLLSAVAAAATCLYRGDARHRKPIEYLTSRPELVSGHGPSRRPAPRGSEKLVHLCGRSVCGREGYSRWASFDLQRKAG